MSLPNEFYLLINDIWPILFIFIIVLVSLRICYFLEKKEKPIFYKEFFGLIFMIYILLLFELVTNTDIQGVSNNFIPFKEIMRYRLFSKYFIWNVVGNIIIFVPFGLAVSLYINPNKCTKPLILTFISSLTIECVQMFIGRSFDIDDIILNCIGGLMGALFYKFLYTIKNNLPKPLQSEGFYNLLTVFLIAIIIIYSLFIGGFIK